MTYRDHYKKNIKQTIKQNTGRNRMGNGRQMDGLDRVGDTMQCKSLIINKKEQLNRLNAECKALNDRYFQTMDSDNLHYGAFNRLNRKMNA